MDNILTFAHWIFALFINYLSNLTMIGLGVHMLASVVITLFAASYYEVACGREPLNGKVHKVFHAMTAVAVSYLYAFWECFKYRPLTAVASFFLVALLGWVIAIIELTIALLFHTPVRCYSKVSRVRMVRQLQQASQPNFVESHDFPRADW